MINFGLNLSSAIDWRECRYFNGQADIRPGLKKRIADIRRPEIQTLIFSGDDLKKEKILAQLPEELAGQVLAIFEDVPGKKYTASCLKASSALISQALKERLRITTEIKDTIFYEPTLRYFNEFKPSLKYFRYMDLQCTNASQIDGGLHTFNERSKPGEFTCDRDKGGLNYEWLVQLAKINNVTPWFCIPHIVYQTDPTFVKTFCKFIQSLMGRDKFILEFSNELWNWAPAFQQTRFAAKVGTEKAPVSVKNKHAYGAAYLQNYMAEIAKKTVGDQVQCVLAGWANGANFNQLILQHVKKELFSYFAVAPYYGNTVFKDPNVTPTLTDAQIVDLLRKSQIERIEKFAKTAEMLKGTNMKLASYELNHHMYDKKGGRHMESALIPELEELTYTLLKSVNAISPDAPHCFFNAGPMRFTTSGSWSITRDYNDVTPVKKGILKYLAE